MAFDINSPLNQELFKQGTALGYSPIQIAASMGTAQTENGGRTGGAPGDMGVKDGLGGAYAAFQWRGPRFDNLKTYASQQGLAWTDPAAQAGYHYAELAGKYPNAGVPEWVHDQYKGATDLDTAVDAVTDSEKPGGWKGGNDNASNVTSYGDRIGNSRVALSALQKMDFTGGDAGQRPDAPVPNAIPTAGIGAPGNDNNSPATQMLSVRNTLAQAQQAPIQPPSESFGHRLMLAGAALMARDNPHGAAALSSMVNSERSNDLQGAEMLATQQKQSATRWHDAGKVANGKYRLMTNDNGDQQYFAVPAEAQDTQEDDKARKVDMQLFQQNSDQIANDRQMINTANQLKENLLSGKLNVTIGPQGLALAQNYTGTAGPNARDLKNMEALVNIQIRNILAMEKGSATDQKMKQALQQVLPDGGKWDNTQVYDALDRMTEIARGRYSGAANTNRSYAKMYPGMASQAHGLDGKPMDLGTAYDADLQKWQGQQDDFDKRKEAFFTRHDGQNARQPAKQSFLDFYGSGGGQPQQPYRDPYGSLPLGPM